MENTLASMRAAFDAGADMLEFDAQVTADGQPAVFHDATLECRTDGAATYPLRGKGAGPMPTVPEVVADFPGRELLIDLKNDDPAEGDRLAAFLSTLPAERRATIGVYGGDAPVDAVAARLPDVRITSKKIVKNGWTGQVPAACGFDQPADLDEVPEHWSGWIWTNRTDVIAPLIRP